MNMLYTVHRHRLLGEMVWVWEDRNLDEIQDGVELKEDQDWCDTVSAFKI